MKVLVAGDYCQRYRVDNAIRDGRYSELFSEIKPFVESADYSILNVEFPIVLTKDDAKPIPKCGPHLQGTIECIDAIKYAGFSCCTLANNHILDQGGKCCNDTKIELEKAGLDTVGAGKNLNEACKTLYKIVGDEKLAIINCCENEFTIATEEIPGANPLNIIQQFYKIQEAKKQADYVLVIVHGGPEFHQLPTPRMQEAYRFFIDAGADSVVNHHQHCYSGYEKYKGKYIFYGLGNLCFDNPNERNGTWNEGYMVELEFNLNSAQKVKIFPYVQCGEIVGIHMMKNINQFQSRLCQLNDIIASKQDLKEATNQYYDRCAISYYAFHNYENKYLNKLWRMGLIPSLRSLKRMFSIWNLIECESHRDKTYYAFNKYLKR